MALVKFIDSVNSSKWSERDKRATQHKIVVEVKHSPINYENLRKLCAIDGLGSRDGTFLSDKAHETFMKNYSSIFSESKENVHGISAETTSRLHKGLPTSSSSNKPSNLKCSKGHASSERDVTKSHNIDDHSSQFRHQPVKVDQELVRKNNINLLRKLLQKLPFERTREDNDSIYRIVKTFDVLTSQIEPHILKELCSVALLDTWDEENITIYGNRGFYVILAGRVKASTPHVRLLRTRLTTECPTPDLDEDSRMLGIGDHFGTLEAVDGRAENTRIFSVATFDSRCEFLLITASDFARITQSIHSKEENRRISLLQSCKSYELWSRQSLLIIANLIKWVKFAPNSVLVTEGSECPFMAIIKSGECKVFRKLEILATLPNMKQERKMKDVLIGRLKPSESFGEINILSDIPMSCSVVTSTQVELAVVYPRDIKGVDVVTKQLINQSCKKVFDQITEDDVHDKYVDCELKRQWSTLKKGVLTEVINATGIQAKCGKSTK